MLQEQVADTINFLKMAGIRVWVLTGDKVATAINIGKSAGLIDMHTDYTVLKDINENPGKEYVKEFER